MPDAKKPEEPLAAKPEAELTDAELDKVAGGTGDKLRDAMLDAERQFSPPREPAPVPGPHVATH